MFDSLCLQKNRPACLWGVKHFSVLRRNVWFVCGRQLSGAFVFTRALWFSHIGVATEEQNEICDLLTLPLASLPFPTLPVPRSHIALLSSVKRFSSSHLSRRIRPPSAGIIT